MVPGMAVRLLQGSDEEIAMISDLVRPVHLFKHLSMTIGKIQKGASSARADDTKSLKGPVLEWITPRGQSLDPPLSRNVKINRGFHHPCTGALLCPAGLDWSDVECVFSFRYIFGC